jgi:toxin ParE1/3/4
MPGNYSVEITAVAEQDVEEIWSYLAAESQELASTFILQLEGQFQNLEQFPGRCALIPENEQLGSSYRHLLYGAYRTIFRITGTTVVILRIIHGSRLLDASGTNPSL